MHNDIRTSTPAAAEMIALCGRGADTRGVSFARCEVRDISHLYGGSIDPSALEGDERRRFFVSYAWRDLARHATTDGLRMIGLVAKLCKPGDDPVHVVARLLQEAGCDLHTGWEDEEDDAGKPGGGC